MLRELIHTSATNQPHHRCTPRCASIRIAPGTQSGARIHRSVNRWHGYGRIPCLCRRKKVLHSQVDANLFCATMHSDICDPYSWKDMYSVYSVRLLYWCTTTPTLLEFSQQTTPSLVGGLAVWIVLFPHPVHGSHARSLVFVRSVARKTRFGWYTRVFRIWNLGICR